MSELQNRKLKVWGSGPIGEVYVFQDGTAADADADHKFDNAFTAGADFDGNGLQTEAAHVAVSTITSSYDDGKTLTFRLEGKGRWKNFHWPQFTPNSRIEFYADTPDTFSGVATDSWHLNNATGQVRWFHGFITETGSTNEGPHEFTCRDNTWAADRITVERDIASGGTIPKIAFNIERESNEEFFFSIKKTDTGVYGTGETLLTSSNDAHKMTLQEILDYLQDAYQTPLTVESLWPASGDLFDSTELASLTLKPGPIILENVGFGEAVRTVLKWAPDRRLWVDHQTLQWRLVPVARALTDTEGTMDGIGVNIGGRGRLPLSSGDLAKFEVGDRVRVYHTPHFVSGVTIGPEVNEEHVIFSKQISYLETTDELVGHGDTANPTKYQTGSKVVKIDPAALPTAGFSVDDIEPGNVELMRDLESHSAVKIWSFNHETKTTTIPYNPTGSITAGPDGELNKGWDAAYEAAWSEGDEDRTHDTGALGTGMEVYRITTDVDSKYLIYIKYTESEHGSNHVNNEWIGVSAWAWTANGTNIRHDNTTWEVLDFTTLADVGDGSPGFEVKVETTTLPADVGGTFLTESADGSGDRIAFAADFRFSTTTRNNGRWEVGRKFYFSSANLTTDISSDVHTNTCHTLRVRSNDCHAGGGRPNTGVNPGLGLPSGNSNTAGPWQVLATGGIGAFHVWRRGTYLQKPIHNQKGFCGAPGYSNPELLQAELETTTITVRAARHPDSGYAGVVKQMYDYDSELAITTSNWTADNQDADYDDLCERIWHLHQKAHNRGSITKPGVKEFGVWSDLAIRGQMVTSSAPAGSSTGLTGFWGAVTAVEVDFDAGTVKVDFDSRSFLKDLATQVWEDLTVSEPAKVNSLLATLRKVNQILRCSANTPPQTSVRGQCGYDVRQGNRNVIVGGPPSNPKPQIPLQSYESDVGIPAVAPSGSAAGSGGKYATHGALAMLNVVRDMVGNYFGTTQYGALHPGTRSGNEFTEDASSGTRFFGLPNENQESLNAIAGGMMGMDPGYPVGPIATQTAAASSSTNIKLAYSGMTSPEFVNGTIEILSYTQGAPRPPYTIDSHGTDNVTLASPMTEDVPGANVPVIIWPAPRPRPNASEFPSGGYVFQDTGGNWAVLDPSGTVFAGTLSGGVVSKATSGSSDIPLRFLASAGAAARHPKYVSGDVKVDVSAPGTQIIVPDPNSDYATAELSPVIEEAGIVLRDARKKWPRLEQHVASWSRGSVVGKDSSRVKRLLGDGTSDYWGQVSVDVPEWHDPSGNIHLYVEWFSDTSPAANRDWVAAIEWRFYTPSTGAGVNPPSLTKAKMNVPVLSTYTSNDRIATQIDLGSPSGPAIAANDVLEFDCYRQAGDASDTFNIEDSGDVYVTRCWLESSAVLTT